MLQNIERLFELDDASCTMRYVDARRRVEKIARIEDGIVNSVCLAGETAAQEWLKNMMVQGASAEATRSWILAPVREPPHGTFTRGAVVCNCFDVSALEVNAALAGGADLAQLQKQLKCGTECGSCLPELKRMATRRADARSLASELPNIPRDVQAISPSTTETTLTVSPLK